MDNCTIDCIKVIGDFSKDATCDFVTNECVQDSVQFIQSYYCWMSESFILLILVSIITLALVYYALNILTEDYLTPCVEQFIHKMNLSQALAGVTFLAFANGAPDIVTAIVAGTSSSQSTVLIPFGSLYGAALFDMGFVLAVVIQFSPGFQLTLKKRQALIPLSFFILGTIYLLCVSVMYGKMNMIIAVFFLSFYFIYIGFVIYEQHKHRKNKKKSMLQAEGSIDKQSEDDSISDSKNIQKQIKSIEESSNQQKQQNKVEKILNYLKIAYRFLFNYTVPPTTKDQWSPVRTIISLVIAPFISCISFGFIQSFQKTLLEVPFAVWFSVPPVLLMIHSIICICRGTRPQNSALYSIYSFIIIICWIAEVCSILINLVQLLQLLTNINSVFLGLTLLAWANSIGDYLSITAFAKRGYASTAIAGIFSGPLMNFLLGFGISCIINSFSGEYDFIIFDFVGDTFQILSDVIVLSVIAMAFFYMVWIFIRIIQRNGTLQAMESKFAMYYYIACLLGTLLLSILTDFYRTVQCDL